jgi:hypothetical protein
MPLLPFSTATARWSKAHAERGGRGGAMRAPGIGVRAQAVMDVEGEQACRRMRGRKCSSTIESRPPLRATAMRGGDAGKYSARSASRACAKAA